MVLIFQGFVEYDFGCCVCVGVCGVEGGDVGVQGGVYCFDCGVVFDL